MIRGYSRSLAGDNRIHISLLHNMHHTVYPLYLASASEDQEEDRHEREDGTSPLSVPAPSASSSTPVKCPLGSKPCKDNKECVLYNHVCDGEKDCADGSDEEECLSACETGNLVVGLFGCKLLYVGEE